MISIILPMCFGAKSLLKSSRSACSFGSADYTFFGINITSYLFLYFEFEFVIKFSPGYCQVDESQ